jgi:hypothetical protein
MKRKISKDWPPYYLEFKRKTTKKEQLEGQVRWLEFKIKTAEQRAHNYILQYGNKDNIPAQIEKEAAKKGRELLKKINEKIKKIS